MYSDKTVMELKLKHSEDIMALRHNLARANDQIEIAKEKQQTDVLYQHIQNTKNN